MHELAHLHFADADAAYEDARYAIFGVPYDGTTSFKPGTRFGPRAIREVSFNFESYDPSTGIDFFDIPVADLGDLVISRLPEEVVDQVADIAGDIVRDGKVPVMLGGEHTATVGAVRAVQPDVYVVCDAHLDLRDELDGTPYSHGCVTRRVLDQGVDDVVIIGARSGDREQFEVAAERTRLYSADTVRESGIGAVLREIREHIGGKRVYLSIDADAIDCCLTPGLGTPEPFGMTPLDIREVVRTLAPHAAGFDYVEVAPFDSGQTAAVAAQVVREFIARHWVAG
ncbi:agmatinase [Methanoculleus sp. CWC-02]|uniref:Agmatinase n=2 Tax=Methanoculleus oceani TaxID=2184756 RepID=A0ABD4TGV1_9EURY|nr:agmatinase [Methanoculleus sp. CWC-02]MCM2466807.1 agmatinase [Methanoculleus sp. CWC-02]